jgi:hypothetical protein
MTTGRLTFIWLPDDAPPVGPGIHPQHRQVRTVSLRVEHEDPINLLADAVGDMLAADDDAEQALEAIGAALEAAGRAQTPVSLLGPTQTAKAAVGDLEARLHARWAEDQRRGSNGGA